VYRVLDLKNIGADAVFKAFKFTKNICNFGDLSLMGKIRALSISALAILVPMGLFAMDYRRLMQ